MVRAAEAAEAPSNGNPARVPSSELRPAPDRAPRSALVEAAGRAVAVAQAPGQGNKAEAEVSRLAPVLNPRAPAETAQQVDTRAAVAHGQIAPVVLTAVPVGAEGGVVGAAGEAEEAGVEAVAGANAKVLNGDPLLQGA